ncbi:MAG: DUF6452 family protein [Flavicella sp.]
MKKIIGILLLLTVLFTACENDDFCSEATTPRLVIGFYDVDNSETFKPVPIYVWADQKDSLYQLAVVDSILLPLDTQNNTATYNLATTNIVDKFVFSYTTKDEFISESCGYIATFNDFSIDSHTNNWIERVEISTTTIDHETASHVKVYH